LSAYSTGRARVNENPEGPRKVKPILQLESLQKSFGGLEAVKDFSLSLSEGELKGLIGPNGAGKSTVFNLVSGFYKPDGGKVFLKGEDITGKSPDRVFKRGIARTFQTVKLMENIPIVETIKTALFLHKGYHIFDVIFQTSRYKRQERELEESALHHLSLLGIAHLKDRLGNELPYGLQRKVSIARALVLSPEVLLLDEPMSGLNDAETNELVEIILRLREDFGLSIILVEHDMKVVMNMCKTVVAMNEGMIIAQGTSQEIRNDPNVKEAYLGTGVS
jgi:branched-chain amino acid transport system ATP-binding protein